jgi:RNA polymerase sigma-70 factor (ECF subfamily)
MSAFVWLRLIAGQTLIDAHRHHLGVQARSPEREMAPGHLNYTQSTSTSLAAQLAARVTSPSQAAARAETLEQLERAIAAMDPIDQEVLALRHFEELSNSEVAEVLGIQQKAASIRYVRAVRRLKEILAPMPEFSQEAGDVH